LKVRPKRDWCQLLVFGDLGLVEGPDLGNRRLLLAGQRAMLEAGLLVAVGGAAPSRARAPI
jgi:hypothetical protein